MRPPDEFEQRDRELLNRIAQGDASAVADLYDRHSSLLYTLILRILRDEHEAQDVLQEVFVSIWTKAHTYNPLLGHPTAWLVGLARNRAVDKWRAARRRNGRNGNGSENGSSNGHIARRRHHAEPHAADPSPESSASRAETAQSVGSALTCLPAEQRELIELAYFEGYTHSELAATCGLPLGTVKTRLRTGLLKLRQILDSPPPVPDATQGRIA